MLVFHPAADNRFRPLLNAVALMLVCVMGGPCNFLTTSFAVLAARSSAFPEEEDHSGKDRTTLVAAAQPSRRGTIRPREVTAPRPTRTSGGYGTTSVPATSQTHRSLTGAGIFQRC